MENFFANFGSDDVWIMRKGGGGRSLMVAVTPEVV